MRLLDQVKNLYNHLLGRYYTNSDAVILAVYMNSEDNEYRHDAFMHWYESIKHLNHMIVECVVGNAEPKFSIGNVVKSNSYLYVRTESLLWHKETLLNHLIKSSGRFKYVFWLDTDVFFENTKWLVESCKKLEVAHVVQPFGWAVHLDRNQSFDEFENDVPAIGHTYNTVERHNHKNKIWNSFGKIWANKDKLKQDFNSLTYDQHGHVGFAWGAQGKYIRKVGLYEQALIGGGDHIMAHAFSNQDDEELRNVYSSSYYLIHDYFKKVNRHCYGVILDYVDGGVQHMWHGDLKDRDYYNRVKDFDKYIPNIHKRNGLYIATDPAVNKYFTKYMRKRENVGQFNNIDYHASSDVADYLVDPETILVTDAIISDNQYYSQINDPSYQQDQVQYQDGLDNNQCIINSDNVCVPEQEYFATHQEERNFS